MSVERLQNHQLVTLGTPFQILPDLDRVVETLDDMVLVDEIPICVRDLGDGSIRITQTTIFENIEMYQPAYTPFGAVSLTYLIDNGLPVPTLDRWPIGIEVYVENLPLDAIRKVNCHLNISGQVFVGVGNYDSSEIKYNGLATLRFDEWTLDLSGKDAGEIYLPKDPTVFEDINITIDLVDENPLITEMD